MTTGSADESAYPARWHDLIPGPDFALGTVAALLGSTATAQTAIETSLVEGALDRLDRRLLDVLPRYRVVASNGDLVLPADHERPAVLRMLEELLRQLVGVDGRLHPRDHRCADLGDIPSFPDDPAALRWFITEFATIHAAQRLAAAMGEDVLVRQFGEVSWAAARVSGRVREMLSLQTLAAEAAERSDHPAASIARARCCWVLLELGRHDEALAAAEYALDLAERHGHNRSRATALHALGEAYHALGRHGDAVETYRNAMKFDVESVRLAADGTTTPLPLSSIGLRWMSTAATHLATGWPAQAVLAATIAVSCIAVDNRRHRDLARARAILGRALLAHDRPDAAIPVLTLAAAALDPTVDRHALADVRALLGEAALATGSPTKAAQHFHAAATLFEQADRPDRARTLRNRDSAGAPAPSPLPPTDHGEART